MLQVNACGAERVLLDGTVADALQERVSKLAESGFLLRRERGSVRRLPVMLDEGHDVHPGGEVQEVGLQATQDITDLRKGCVGSEGIDLADRVGELLLAESEENPVSTVAALKRCGHGCPLSTERATSILRDRTSVTTLLPPIFLSRRNILGFMEKKSWETRIQTKAPQATRNVSPTRCALPCEPSEHPSERARGKPATPRPCRA